MTILLNVAKQVLMYQAHFATENMPAMHIQAQLNLENDDTLSRKNMKGHITTSALVIDSAREKVLLIYHIRHDRWLTPGGHFEGDESLVASAMREAVEETGVSGLTLHAWPNSTSIPFDIDTHAIMANPAKGESKHVHHDFMFLFEADSTKPVQPQLDEVSYAEWKDIGVLKELHDFRFSRLYHRLKKEGVFCPVKEKV